MANKIFNININLEEQADISQSIINISKRSARNKTLSLKLKDVLEVSFKNIFQDDEIYLNKLNDKIKYIFDQLKVNKFKMIPILKSSNLLDLNKWLQTANLNGEEKRIKNLDLIICLKETDQLFNQLKYNRIILTINLFKCKNRNIISDLKNLRFSNESSIYENKAIPSNFDSSMIEYKDEFNTNNKAWENNPISLGQISNNNFFQDNIFDFETWYSFLDIYHQFLDNKKNEFIKIVTLEDIKITNDKEETYSFWALIKKEKKDFYDNKMLKIYSENDSSLSLSANIISKQIWNYQQAWEESQKKIDEIKTKMQEEKVKKKELQIKQEKKINELKDLENNKFLYSQEISNLNPKKELKSEKIDWKKDIEVKEIINIFKKKIEELENQINSLREIINIFKKKIEELENQINSLREEEKKEKENNKMISFCIEQLEKEEAEIFIFEIDFKNNDLTDSVFIKKSSSISELLTNKDSIYKMSNFDLGSLIKIRRMKTTMQIIKLGRFKSPYLLLSLNDNLNYNDLEKMNKINTKINLNTLQEQAAKITINSHFSSFLQGPPGTGKTQTISAIIEHFIHEGKTTLISSSTNEAINNVFDRIYKDNCDPNFIFLRMTSKSYNNPELKKYTEEYITYNILNQMDQYFITTNRNKILDNLLKNYPQKNNKPLFYYPEKFNDNYIIKQKNLILQFFPDIEDKYFLEDFEDEIKKENKKFIRSNEKYHKKLSNFISQYEVPFNSEAPVYTFLKNMQNNKKTKFMKLLLDINEKLEQKKISNSSFNQKVLQIVEEKQLVNVIGLTTTSNLKIELNKREYELFSEYPVHFATIDEVSKSITPEILSISILADKFLYSGDYRQLQPILDINDNTIKELFQNLKKKEGKFVENLNDWRDLKRKLVNLYQNNIFQKQIFAIKAKQNKSNYVALKEQYRFPEQINNVVNSFYKDEVLQTVHKDEHFKKIIGPKKSISFFQIVDTSYLSSDYIQKIKAKISSPVANNMTAFDQKIGLLTEYRPRALINEYNAWTIQNILSGIIENNKVQKNQIGVITMNRSQANIIIDLLNKNEKLKGIKVDTVDNFQGRERDIIILDLVRAKNKLNEKKIIEQPAKRDLSFYKNPERLNVSLSRAKNKLIVVGAIKGFLEDKIWSEIRISENKSERVQIFKQIVKYEHEYEINYE